MPMVPCTIVSLLPYPLNEDKPIDHGSFHMAPAAKDDFEILVIGDKIEFTRNFYVSFDRGNLKLPVDPEEVARAIVEDHLRATVQTGPDARPGLFYLPGILTKEEVKSKHKVILDKARKEQNNWYGKLVKAADDTWQRYRRHNMITDQHRYAANALGLKREWAEEMKAENTVQCVYCTSLISDSALVCPVCRLPQQGAINRLEPKARDVVMKTLGLAPTQPVGG